MTAESPNGNGRPLLEINDLRKHFRVGRETLKAVDGISLKIDRRDSGTGRRVGVRQDHGEFSCGSTSPRAAKCSSTGRTSTGRRATRPGS